MANLHEAIYALNTSIVTIRGNVAYNDKISFYYKKAMRYSELGCSGISRQIMSYVKQLKDQCHELYFGFNRITITNAAIILAKYLGYKLNVLFVF